MVLTTYTSQKIPEARVQVQHGSITAKVRLVIELQLDWHIYHLQSRNADICQSRNLIEETRRAAPIVAVPKKDGRYRISGDYKVTINPSLDINLPNPSDLFASLAGGQKFTKLDLSQAYQYCLIQPLKNLQPSPRARIKACTSIVGCHSEWLPRLASSLWPRYSTHGCKKLHLLCLSLKPCCSNHSSTAARFFR